MSDASEWELTPWWLRAFGYKPWRYWTTMINVGGDFSYWTYAGTPNASISNRRAGSENKAPAPVQHVVPDGWLCSAPPGEWSSGRIEADSTTVQGLRDRGYKCVPYWLSPPPQTREEG